MNERDFFDLDDEPGGDLDDLSDESGRIETFDDGLSEAEREAEALLHWRSERDRAKAAEEALFEAQLREAASLSPDYVPEPPPLSAIEKAAQAASTMDAAELDAFRASLKAANDALIAKARAGREGFDFEGNPVEPPAPPFDPSGLDSDAFKIFMAAAARGAADPLRTPAGFTPSQWERAVESALTGGPQ